MNKLDAYKMDSLGNDFIIFDKRKKSISLTKDQIIKISNRNYVGCDQVIFIICSFVIEKGFFLLSNIMKSLPRPSIL